MYPRSKHLFHLAKQVIPGGVNSPVRAFHGVGGDPLFIKRGFGPYIEDVDGREYVDYVCSFGPLLMGHAHPYVLEKITEAMKDGFGFGASTEIEIKLAEKICSLMPAIEKVRFVNSGTEAAMSAIRLARGYTRKNKVIKFAGCYHGHADGLLVQSGSGPLTLGVPHSAGVPASVAEHTLVAEFNRLEEVAALLTKYGEEVAAIIVEPVAGNMNCILPVPGFLQGLRELCDRYHVLLIFDEVMTGFRIALGGASAYYNIKPDLTILGKIIGGGFPVGAFGGRAEIMNAIAPLGPVYQAGTLSGNPVAMTAGFATLEVILRSPDFYQTLSAKTQKLMQALMQEAKLAGIPFKTHSLGGLFGLFFTDANVIQSEADAKHCNLTNFAKFFHGMLREGIYFAPSAFEAGFMSHAHTETEIDRTVSAARKVFASLEETSIE